jgi:hypothetical protein
LVPSATEDLSVAFGTSGGGLRSSWIVGAASAALFGSAVASGRLALTNGIATGGDESCCIAHPLAEADTNSVR